MQRIAILLIVLATVVACSEQGNTPRIAKSVETKAPHQLTASPLILFILPVESAASIYERFLPLAYFIEDALRRPVTIKIAKDYESAIQEIGSGRVHIACLDPATYCEIRARFRKSIIPLVTTMRREGVASRSVLVAKTGSGIEKIVDVRGKRLALGSEESSFSYLIPLSMLKDVNISEKDFTAVDFLRQEDRVALSVLIGEHDVGALSESVATKYLPSGLRVIATSEAIPHFVLCASEGISADIRKALVQQFLSLRDSTVLSPLGKEIEGFVVAEDRSFDVVRVMIRNLTGKDYIEYGPKTVKVAILPLYSAITLYERYEPLMRYLSSKTGYEFKLVIPKDFDDFASVVKSGAVDFSYQNPYIFAQIDKEKPIKALATTVSLTAVADGQAGTRFRGVIITRQESAIRDVEGLRNKRVLVVSPKSAGGYLSQKLFLQGKGIDVERDLRIIDAKRQESVILGVYRGEADAGFVRESALSVLTEKVDMRKIRVLAITTSLPNWPFAACADKYPGLAAKVARLLTEITDPEILKAANISGFQAVDETEFENLKQYVQ